MCIYNLLFYKTYLLAIKSGNFDDIPVLGGLMFIVLCVMLNIFTIFGFIEGLGIEMGITFSEEYKFPFCLLLVGFLLFYYLYKGRYKKIVEYYEQKEGLIKRLHPVVVIIVYLVLSFFLMLLAATFKNHDWIFA